MDSLPSQTGFQVEREAGCCHSHFCVTRTHELLLSRPGQDHSNAPLVHVHQQGT